jgi:hypothetical protein
MIENYILIRKGVYRHEILGIYEDLDIAIHEAKQALEREEDDYHNICLCSAEINKPIDDVKEIRRFNKRMKVDHV